MSSCFYPTEEEQEHNKKEWEKRNKVKNFLENNKIKLNPTFPYSSGPRIGSTFISIELEDFLEKNVRYILFESNEMFNNILKFIEDNEEGKYNGSQDNS